MEHATNDSLEAQITSVAEKRLNQAIKDQAITVCPFKFYPTDTSLKFAATNQYLGNVTLNGTWDLELIKIV